MCARAKDKPAKNEPKFNLLAGWHDLMERLDDQGRWQRPVFLMSLIAGPILLGGIGYALWPKPEQNRTWVYISAEGLNRMIGHTLTGMPGGRDIEIRVCNAPRSASPYLELNGKTFDFESSEEWQGYPCLTERVVTPNLKGEVIASNIPGRLIALRKQRSAVGPDGSGQPLKWRVLDRRSTRVLAEGTLPIDGVKPMAKLPGIPRINMGGNWYYGRTMQLVDYWSMTSEAQATFYTPASVTQSIFIPSNPAEEGMPFELGPDGKKLVALWGENGRSTMGCKQTPGQLIDYIYTNKDRNEIRVLNIQTIEIPAFSNECR